MAVWGLVARRGCSAAFRLLWWDSFKDRRIGPCVVDVDALRFVVLLTDTSMVPKSFHCSVPYYWLFFILFLQYLLPWLVSL